jgi:D-3-phosphoglycerate dehydrogenase
MVNIKRLVYFENWVDDAAVAALARRLDIDLVRLRYATPESENWTELKTAHGYQIHPRGDLQRPWFGDAALLARCPRLLAISSTGAGYDMVDVEACTAAGVIVCNQSGTNFEAVAEHAIGMMLALSKKFGITDKKMRREPGIDRFAHSGRDIYGKTVGIVGIGHIGRRTAQLCRGLFEMEVLAYDPYLTADEIAERQGVKVELEELLRRADFVSIHCPRSEETLGMFGRAQFALMKPTAYFITTARGGIHDEDDLADALRESRIAGAGLDVWLKEPPSPDHPLLAFDNVVASPHTAGVTKEAMHQMAVAAAEQWIAIFAGEVPSRLVNPEAWPRYSERFAQQLGFAPASLQRPAARQSSESREPVSGS